MRLKNLDLIGGIFFAILCVGWAWLPDRPLVIGVILALPLVFVLPGYMLTQALFHKRIPDTSDQLILQPKLRIGQPVGTVDYIIFSLGLSMAIDVIMGFILNILPMGLQLRSWAISLGLVTTIFALLAAGLRRRDTRKSERSSKFHISIYDVILLGLAIVVAFVAVWSSIIRPPQPPSSFTQFWMLPSSAVNKGCAVSIGVQNYESTSMTYRIEVTINAKQAASWPSITLTTQQKWERVEPVTSAGTQDILVDAQLYRLDKPGSIYQEVHVTLSNCPVSTPAH